MYRCVKMKIEVGRERQRGQNNFKYVNDTFLNRALVEPFLR
jgi:hypothetical protein